MWYAAWHFVSQEIVNRHFGGACCLHVQGRSNPEWVFSWLTLMYYFVTYIWNSACVHFIVFVHAYITHIHQQMHIIYIKSLTLMSCCKSYSTTWDYCNENSVLLCYFTLLFTCKTLWKSDKMKRFSVHYCCVLWLYSSYLIRFLTNAIFIHLLIPVSGKSSEKERQGTKLTRTNTRWQFAAL
jgi:hypothetical protein